MLVVQLAKFHRRLFKNGAPGGGSWLLIDGTVKGYLQLVVLSQCPDVDKSLFRIEIARG